jgi:hypothetical protein
MVLLHVDKFLFWLFHQDPYIQPNNLDENNKLHHKAIQLNLVLIENDVKNEEHYLLKKDIFINRILENINKPRPRENDILAP